MIPCKFLWKPLVQKAVTGKASRFCLMRQEPKWPKNLSFPGLYLHIPFCKNLCPYCPYNRVEYDESLFASYESAVKQEVDMYVHDLQGLPFVSLYVGGGTPTVNWKGLLRILDHMRRRLSLNCDICVELHPANMEKDCLVALKDMGVTMLSIGVESTSDILLERIQRSHDGSTAIHALKEALGVGFKSVNVDLMFALPGETLEDWKSDVRAVVDIGVDQVSTYPLFSFPYSDLGRTLGIKKVTRPPHRIVKAMLDFTDEYCAEKGLHRCAVWSWLKPSKNKFSSITRHHYVGFGPSAASMTGTDFYVNTFHVEAYAKCLPNKRPVALSMSVDRHVEMAYWLYWRIYELEVRDIEFQRVFGNETSLKEQFGHLFWPFITMGMMERTNDSYRVTKAGAYWIHRLQNEYSLNYITNLWGTCRREPWPSEVRL